MEKHTGGCHCKAVRYEVGIDLTQPVIICNCSHCQIKGLMLSFVSADEFTLLSGEGALTEYRFNTEKIAHLFCRTCGVESFARGEKKDGTPTIAINIRALDGVDIDALTIKKVDGKSY